MYKKMPRLDYEYKNLPIYGGGFVTGFTFHPNAQDRLYIRTDIGGMYRYDYADKEWKCLCEHVKATDMAETYPLSADVDKDFPDRLFFVCGNNTENYLCISEDCGKSIIRRSIPCRVHGNAPSRGTGERLVYRNGRLYFGSMSDGILVTDDLGESWERIELFGEKNISCLWVSEDGNTIVAGTSGEANSPDGITRGPTLYYSADRGESFNVLTYPKPQTFENASYYGYVPQRIACDGECLYITFSASDKVFWGGWDSYSCDSGNLADGRIYKYKITNGVPVFIGDITPEDKTDDRRKKINGGYGGICFEDGMLVACTMCRTGGDIIYRSFDGGEHWEIILKNLEIGEIDWTVSYMKPEYSGNCSCIHWMSDFKISPNDPNFALFNTGTGVFCTENLRDSTVKFRPLCNGLEETVHLNVYSTPFGKTRVIDIVGDLGGFAFEDIDKPCENTFADENGNRYITCLNADFTFAEPQRIAATPRGNWTGLTKGGVILSENGGVDWKRLPDPLGITREINEAIEKIRQPNTDSGWVAMSADGKRICWSMTGRFSSDMTVYTDDEGQNWYKSVFLDSNEKIISSEMTVKIFSDLYDPNCAFAITADFRLFVSFDKFASFRQTETGVNLERVRHNRFQTARQPNVPYTFWLAAGKNGLYRFVFDRTGKVSAVNILEGGDCAMTVGFGKGAGTEPCMYATGIIGGEYGFYRSDDLGGSWVKINSNTQCFGEINSICGDMREYGRFYLATGTKGLITGAPADM